MKRRIKYTNEPLGAVKIIDDFLPPPSELVPREDVEKVTISLSRRSVDFFRAEARQHGTQYQRMIRALLDRYAQLNASADNRVQRARGKGGVVRGKA
jgi:hypothetical protein